jgi:hypothetical protein
MTSRVRVPKLLPTLSFLASFQPLLVTPLSLTLPSLFPPTPRDPSMNACALPVARIVLRTHRAARRLPARAAM